MSDPYRGKFEFEFDWNKSVFGDSVILDELSKIKVKDVYIKTCLTWKYYKYEYYKKFVSMQEPAGKSQ